MGINSPPTPKGGLIQIFPNPATESFTLSVYPEMIGATYTFSDIMCRMIESNVIEKENTSIGVGSLAPGLYILQLKGKSYKVVKE